MKRAIALLVITASVTLAGCGADESRTASDNCKAAGERKTGQAIRVNTVGKEGDGYNVIVSFERNDASMASQCHTDDSGKVMELGPFVRVP